MANDIPQKKTNGYALLIGIKDFQHFNSTEEVRHQRAKTKKQSYNKFIVNDLIYTHRSVEDFKAILKQQQGRHHYADYDVSPHIILQDGNATYTNVVNAILSLANKAKKGDLVTITFSTHGTSSKSLFYLNSLRPDPQNTKPYNAIALYDQLLTEGELYVLLLLFQKGVRIYICFDCCAAATWLDFKQWQPNYTQTILNQIYEKMYIYWLPSYANTFIQAYKDILGTRIELSASICVLGIGNDSTLMIDDFSMSKIILLAFNFWKEEVDIHRLAMLYSFILLHNILQDDKPNKTEFIQLWNRWKNSYSMGGEMHGAPKYIHQYTTSKKKLDGTFHNWTTLPHFKENPMFTFDVVNYNYGLRISYIGKDTNTFFQTPAFGYQFT